MTDFDNRLPKREECSPPLTVGTIFGLWIFVLFLFGFISGEMPLFGSRGPAGPVNDLPRRDSMQLRGDGLSTVLILLSALAAEARG